MIKGDGFVLRTVRESDLDFLYETQNDVLTRGDFIQVRMGSQPGFRKQFQETGFFTPDDTKLLIVDSEDGRLLGQIGWFRTAFYADGLEIGYLVFNEIRRGKGLMTSALRLLCSYLFADRNVNRLQLGIMPGNHASRRVAEKAGFTKEGVLREAVFQRGEHHDLEIYSLLRREWTPEPPFLPIPKE